MTKVMFVLYKGLENLVRRCQKCISISVDYIEEQNRFDFIFFTLPIHYGTDLVNAYNFSNLINPSSLKIPEIALLCILILNTLYNSFWEIKTGVSKLLHTIIDKRGSVVPSLMMGS